MSLRSRIIVSTLVIIFLIIIGSYLVIQDIQTGIIERDFHEKGTLLSNHLAMEITKPMLVDDLTSVRYAIENSRNSYPDIEYVFVTDSSGTVLVQTSSNFPTIFQNMSNPANVENESVYKTDKGIIHEFDVPLANSTGYLHVGLSEKGIRSQIQEASQRLLLLALSAIVLGGIFTYFIGRRLTEPVLLLTEGANRINKGILDQKIDIKTDDELSELARTFNEMASSLNQKLSDLVASKEETEIAQKYLETLFNNIEDGIIVMNSNHEIIKTNESFLRLMGLTEKDVMGRSCHELIFGLQNRKGCPIDNFLQTKNPSRFMHEMKTNEKRKILEINPSFFQDKKGVENIILVIRDITQQKMLEEENIAFYNNIKYLNEFNEEILNNVNLAIHVVDKDMNILAVNDELIKLGRGRFRKEQIINKNLFEVFPVLKEKQLDKEYDYVFKTGETFLSEEKTEYYGEEIYTSTSKIPIKNKSGVVEKIITVIKDVSDQKKLEEELKDSYEELKLTYSKLKELYKMKDNFLSSISHELRTPLTSVIGFTELLLDENLTQEERHKAEIILRNSKRLSRLIRALLDTTLIESMSLQLDLAEVEINELVFSVVEDMKNNAESKNLHVSVDIPEHMVIKGDKDRLLQVFSNILDNAIKFTMAGEIRITATCEEENIHIKFNDTGIGIPESELVRIFERFYQVDSSNSKKYGGIGLGLWISKNIVEAHGGKIWAESKNRGSTFHILLPRLKNE